MIQETTFFEAKTMVETKKRSDGSALSVMAEEEGFEPSLPGLRVKRFSSPPHSTPLPPLRKGDAAPKGGGDILAERWGFEPQIPFWGIHDFQSCSFGQLGHLSTASIGCC